MFDCSHVQPVTVFVIEYWTAFMCASDYVPDSASSSDTDSLMVPYPALEQFLKCVKCKYLFCKLLCCILGSQAIHF